MFRTSTVLRSCAVSFLLIAASCTPDTPPPPAKEAHANGLTISYRLPTGTIPLNEPFPVIIAVESAAGPLPATAAVQVDARMPAHNHGMPVRPEVVPIEPGLWRADPMLFQMPGHWQLIVTVGTAPTTTQVAFDIHVRP
ncbi:MAG: hypothetical protein D6761_02630 [Candidatus Dadabacteria bacterium]|nr:MAG: hypothetical protein D6761_02630 [Candidatus Dadabacteria bacterium]